MSRNLPFPQRPAGRARRPAGRGTVTPASSGGEAVRGGPPRWPTAASPADVSTRRLSKNFRRACVIIRQDAQSEEAAQHENQHAREQNPQHHEREPTGACNVRGHGTHKTRRKPRRRQNQQGASRAILPFVLAAFRADRENKCADLSVPRDAWGVFPGMAEAVLAVGRPQAARAEARDDHPASADRHFVDLVRTDGTESLLDMHNVRFKLGAQAFVAGKSARLTRQVPALLPILRLVPKVNDAAPDGWATMS